MPISNGLLLALTPAAIVLAGVIGGIVVALYIHYVTIPRLDHITELTNSTLMKSQEAVAAAHTRIDELEKEILGLKEGMTK